MSDLRHYDLSDEIRLRLKPLLLKATGRGDRRGDDNRLFINAILFELRTGKQPGGIYRPLMATGRMFPFAFSGGAAGAFLSGL